MSETRTFVFTDLVGSTELANRIGPGPADDIRREHFTLLRKATAAAGGTEVKNLGDGLMLAFTSAVGALDAAVATQRAIDARNREAAVRFEVRIGVAHGEVTVEDEDYFGEPVVQAARLCALAEGGQVLATELTRLVASAATSHQLVPVGELTLKGLPQPVLAHEVVWAVPSETVWPLPRRLRGAPESVYVGRAAERALLEEAWAEATAGRASMVLVGGEPGVGKTRLVTNAAIRVHDAGGTVLVGAVDETLGVPFQPWIEALGHYVEHAPAGVLRPYVHRHGSDVARLVPGLHRRVPDLPPMSSSDGETERYHLIEAVTQLLRAAAADDPVLILLDDLHWADAPTLSLLLHVHRNLADSRVLILGTFRDSALAVGERLSDTLVALRGDDRARRITMTGLDATEIQDLLEQASGQAPTQDSIDLARTLERDTNGNPLFVAEILRDLLETGQLKLDDQGVWGLATTADDLRPPASVRDVVTQRVERLGPQVHRVLVTAAVVGRDFDLDLLSDVLDTSEDELIDAIETGMAASLLTESGAAPGSLRFVHGLIANALADELSSVRRRQLHRRIATSIEARHGPHLGARAAAVAHHLLAAGDETRKCVEYARQAGRHALSVLAPDEALRWFETALDLLDGAAADPGLRCDLLTDLGEAARDAGRPGYRDRLLAAAQAAAHLGDGDRMARAVLDLNRSFAASIGTADAELVAAIEQALALCPARDHRRARLLGMLGSELMMVGDLDRRRTLVAESLSIADELDEITQARVLVSALSALWHATTLPDRLELLRRLRGLLPRVPDPQVRAFAAFHGIWTALETGDRFDLDRSLQDARAMASTAAQPTTRWILAFLESIVTGVDGDLDAAEALADAALEQAATAGLSDGLAIYSGQLIAIRLLQGRLGELAEVIEEAVEANPAIGTEFTVTRSLALYEAGHPGRGAEELIRALQRPPSSWVENVIWSSGLDAASMAAAALGDRAALEALRDGLRPVEAVDALVMSGATCSGHLANTLGRVEAALGNRTAAVAAFTRAEAMLEALGAPVLLAWNRFEHGRALLTLADPADRPRARALLGRALDAFRVHGCPVRVRQCEDLLSTIAGT